MGEVISTSAFGNRFSNLNLLTENDFNITPSNISIWTGDIPYKKGDRFPTEEIQTRANEYLTAYMLYKTKFDGIMDSAFSWTDYMTKPLTNYPNMAIVSDLPEIYTIVEEWVSILGSTPPSITSVIDDTDNRFNSVSSNLRKLSSVLDNSNLPEVWQDIIRCAQFTYGNKTVRVSKSDTGNVRIDNIVLKCWQPLVSQDNPNKIECNLFFNIFEDEDGQKKCEFIAYVEDGQIIKKTFIYSDGYLGDEIGDIEEGEAFDGVVKMSPIQVFTGTSIQGEIFGISQIKNWEAPVASHIRNHEAIGILVEQLKDELLLIPEGAAKLDESTGITYKGASSTIFYTDLDKPPTVQYVKPNVQMDQMLTAYREGIATLSRYTGLPVSFFDTRELKVAASGTAMKASMYKTEIMAASIAVHLKRQLKQLISKIAIAAGIDLDDSTWDVVINTNFLIDANEQNSIIQSRTGGAVTMSVAEAIKKYDNVSYDIALMKAAKLKGETIDSISDDIENSDGTGENEVNDNIEFTSSPNVEEIEKPVIEYPMGMLPL